MEANITSNLMNLLMLPVLAQTPNTTVKRSVTLTLLLTTPSSIYDYDLVTKEKKLMKQQEVLVVTILRIT